MWPSLRWRNARCVPGEQSGVSKLALPFFGGGRCLCHSRPRNKTTHTKRARVSFHRSHKQTTKHHSTARQERITVRYVPELLDSARRASRSIIRVCRLSCRRCRCRRRRSRRRYCSSSPSPRWPGRCCGCAGWDCGLARRRGHAIAAGRARSALGPTGARAALGIHQ